MKKTISKYSRERLEVNYITAIWFIRVMFIVNIITAYKLFS